MHSLRPLLFNIIHLPVYIFDKCDNNVIDDLEKESTKELMALNEKINYYKDVFQIDIEADTLGEKDISRCFEVGSSKFFKQIY